MLAGRGLRARIGDHAVPEQLERDPGLGGDRPAHVQVRGVVHGSVADVLDEVRAVGKRREPDPGQALGYLGPITSQEMKQQRLPSTGFAGEDLVGQAGLEEEYNAQMEGTPGTEVLSVNSAGEELGTVKNTPAKSGDVTCRNAAE